jgi:hypothetical protein
MRSFRLVGLMALCLLFWLSILAPARVKASTIYVNDYSGAEVHVRSDDIPNKAYDYLAVEFQITVWPNSDFSSSTPPSDAGPSFKTIGYCTEFGQYAGKGWVMPNYVITPVNTSDSESLRKAAEVVRLYAPGLGYTGYTADHVSLDYARAAVQLAVWEFTYEKSGTYDIKRGSFFATDGTNSEIRDLANKYIGLVTGSSFQHTATAISAANQNLLIGTHAPIPGAVWLFGSGLVGLLGFRRKFSK